MKIPQPLPYETPDSTLDDVDGLLKSARKCALIGIVVPFFSLFACLWAALTLAHRKLSPADRRQAVKWLLVGLGICIVNPFLCVGLLLPSMGRSRPAANVIKCSSNLRQIGLAIQMYASENGDALPPNVQAILLTQDVTTDVFTCPSNDCADTLVRAPTTQRAAALVVQGTSTCSYYLCQFGTRKLGDLSPSTVLMFEKSGNHVTQTHGMNFLTADGLVSWVAAPQCEKVMNELAAGQNPPPTLSSVP